MKAYPYLTLFVFIIFTVVAANTAIGYLFSKDSFTLNCEAKAPGVVSCEVK